MDWKRVWRRTREDVFAWMGEMASAVPRRFSIRLLAIPLVLAGLVFLLAAAGTVMRGVIGWAIGYDTGIGHGFAEGLAISVGWGLVAYFGVYAPYQFLSHWTEERSSWRHEVERLRRKRLADG